MITLEQVRAWRPCPDYTDERLLELAAGRESITPLEAMDLPIPAKDRVWLLIHPGVLPAVVRHAWVEVVVSRAVRAHALSCGIAEVEQWAARWFAGDIDARTGTTVRTARKLAWGHAVRNALAGAAAAAVESAKWAAVSNAADAMFWASQAAIPQSSAERERQIADLRAILATHAVTA